MFDSSDIDKKVGFWIKGVPYIWGREYNGHDISSWMAWGRTYIFGYDIKSFGANLLPVECDNDSVKNYFQTMHITWYNNRKKGVEYDVRIEGQKIDSKDIQDRYIKNIGDYRYKKLKSHIIYQNPSLSLKARPRTRKIKDLD